MYLSPEMKVLEKMMTLSLAVFTAAMFALPVKAEPLVTTVGFAKSAYSDGATNEIVVKITRAFFCFHHTERDHRLR
jgi:hypothetical protein